MITEPGSKAEDEMSERRETRATVTVQRMAPRHLMLAGFVIAAIAAPARAADVTIDATISCTPDHACADVFEVRCPQPSRYLCASVENEPTPGVIDKHAFHLSAIGTSPAVFVAVGDMVKILPDDEQGVCLTKPRTSSESGLRGVVTVTRSMVGGKPATGPAPYRLRAFCVSDADGANQTVATLVQNR